jgi:hypothetical protein
VSGGVNKTDSFGHAGLGYREFIVPSRIVNRYGRSSCEDEEGDEVAAIAALLDPEGTLSGDAAVAVFEPI